MLLQEMVLNEVFVVGDKSYIRTGTEVLAYEKWIWVFDNEDPNKDDILADANKKLGTNYSDPYEFQEYMEDNPRVIYGIIDGNDLEINIINFRQGAASKTLYKVMKELGLDDVKVSFYSENTEDENDIIYDGRDELLEPLAKKDFYHGTSFDALRKIAKLGLMPQEKSTFDQIVHSDKIFITINLEKAVFHATNAAQKRGDNVPIVLILKIPDVDKLVLDYDVAIQFYGEEHDHTYTLGYSDVLAAATRGPYSAMTQDPEIKKYVSRIRKNPDALNTSLGIFGYIGRIPASHIHHILIDENLLRSYILQQEIGIEDEENPHPEPIRNWGKYTLEEFFDYYTETYRDIMSEFIDQDEDEEY